MPRPSTSIRPADYDLNIFINCPFDDAYRPLFRALVFAVIDCGMRARCALEIADSSDARIDKIMRLIGSCRWGIHDISRTELNANALPRFNMPFELGLFLGARRFGDRKQQSKNCLILDRAPHRYQEYLSDIAGQDIASHGGNPSEAIGMVRQWLATARPSAGLLPGAAAVNTRYQKFSTDLPSPRRVG